MSNRPKIIVNEYKSLDEELEALVAGIFRQGRDSVNWVVDWREEAKNHLIPASVALIQQAFEKWSKHDER